MRFIITYLLVLVNEFLNKLIKLNEMVTDQINPKTTTIFSFSESHHVITRASHITSL